jgi:hypothetical protein
MSGAKWAPEHKQFERTRKQIRHEAVFLIRECSESADDRREDLNVVIPNRFAIPSDQVQHQLHHRAVFVREVILREGHRYE